jgi:hypothetical protein
MRHNVRLLGTLIQVSPLDLPLASMLEFFAYKRYKKHKLKKMAERGEAKEVLDKPDESFLRQLLRSEKGRKWFRGNKVSKEEVAVKGEQETGEPPAQQEDELQAILNSLNLAVDKVPLAKRLY